MLLSIRERQAATANPRNRRRSRAIEIFYAGALASGVTDHRVEVIDVGGDEKIIYATARWSAKGKDKDGKPATFSGFVTHLFERQPDNSLKIAMQTWN